MLNTLEQIRELTDILTVDTNKAYKGNVSAGIRARKTSQDIKSLLQKLRAEILDHKKDTDKDV